MFTFSGPTAVLSRTVSSSDGKEKGKTWYIRKKNRIYNRRNGAENKIIKRQSIQPASAKAQQEPALLV